MKYLKNTLLTASGLLFVGNSLIFGGVASSVPTRELASKTISLENRAAPGSFMAEVMRDNILLTIGYMRGITTDGQTVDWEAVRKPFTYSFELRPNEAYSFQKDALASYEADIVKTIDVNFAGQNGFKHDGYLMGDGVCHLASLFYWAALDANLDATAPVNHDFMVIPEVPREYGVSIYSTPGQKDANAQQNLYIRNNTKNTIRFEITYDGKNLETKVLKLADNTSTKDIVTEVI
ncbi:MAG: VanW family protein [Candidatus Levybacteria bacterium]|nr:VanW family protein [Candidatus Levybacteria bacterium]